TGGAARGLGPGLARTDQQGAGPGTVLERGTGRGGGALGAVGHALAVVAVARDRVDAAQLGLLARAHAREEVEDLGDLPRGLAGLRTRLGGLVGPGLPEAGAQRTVRRRHRAAVEGGGVHGREPVL